MNVSIPEKIRQIRQQISQFEERYGREPGSVKLLAVSKTHPVDVLAQAISAGQNAFGENYVQEALAKIDALASPALQWHFIGPVQSNKTRPIAENFNWVHSVDRIKIAHRLSEQRPGSLPPLKVLLQVNLDDEQSKSGVSLRELPLLAREVAALENLVLAGLMTIPAPGKTFTEQRDAFRRLRQAGDDLQAAGLSSCRELSMGMSEDFEAAIAEGSTIIRIGSAIFGPRAQLN